MYPVTVQAGSFNRSVASEKLFALVTILRR
jgi:hypothetical protein